MNSMVSCSGGIFTARSTGTAPYLDVQVEFLNASGVVQETMFLSDQGSENSNVIITPTDEGLDCSDITSEVITETADELIVNYEVSSGGINVSAALLDGNNDPVKDETRSRGNIPKARIRVRKRTI